MKAENENRGAWSRMFKNRELWSRKVRWLDRRLENKYHSPLHGNYKNTTDEIFYIILSKKTPPSRYRQVFKQLRRECRPWANIRSVPQERIAQILHPLGISNLRAQQIKAIADKLHQDFGRISLSPLKRLGASEARRYLKSLPGVGEKCARCVMMYSLGFDISPMDTHATRVLSRFGLLPENVTSAQAHSIMDERLPKGMALRLHVNLVAHGRSTCSGRQPACEKCFVRSRCYIGAKDLS
jgi:endonuclease-3